MYRYNMAIFICLVIFLRIVGVFPCKLSKNDNHDVRVHHNFTSLFSESPPITKLKERQQDKEVITQITWVYQKNGRRGGTPDPPKSGEEGGKRVPTELTTDSGDLQGGKGKTIDPRFTTEPTTKKRRVRTTPPRASFAEDCDYLSHYCYKAYKTGKLCARTLYYTYYTFENYCMMDYVNCMERFEIWQVVHMGSCFNIKVLEEYSHYPIEDDHFLDQDAITEII